jgi:hypothetical protein
MIVSRQHLPGTSFARSADTAAPPLFSMSRDNKGNVPTGHGQSASGNADTVCLSGKCPDDTLGRHHPVAAAVVTDAFPDPAASLSRLKHTRTSASARQ